MQGILMKNLIFQAVPLLWCIIRAIRLHILGEYIVDLGLSSLPLRFEVFYNIGT